MEANLDDVDLMDGGLAAVGGTKKRHVFVRLMNGEAYNFLDKPDPKEEKMYACLAVTQPFCTAKYKGVTEAWTAAVADINKQRDMKTGVLLFDPHISVKAVRDRFEAVMKIAKEIQAKVPFRSGNDDEEPPTPLMQLIEDLLEMKNSFEAIQTGVKDGTLAKKKKDREAAKAIQQASLGALVARKASSSSTSDSESDASSKPPKKKGKSDSNEKNPRDSDEKKPHVSMSDTLASFSGAVEARVVDQASKKAAKLELKQRKFEIQAEMKKQEMQLKKQDMELKKCQAEYHERQASQQLEFNAQMIALMKSMQNNRGDDN
jgi:hypothetical protein